MTEQNYEISLRNGRKINYKIEYMVKDAVEHITCLECDKEEILQYIQGISQGKGQYLTKSICKNCLTSNYIHIKRFASHLFDISELIDECYNEQDFIKEMNETMKNYYSEC